MPVEPSSPVAVQVSPMVLEPGPLVARSVICSGRHGVGLGDREQGVEPAAGDALAGQAAPSRPRCSSRAP